MSDKTMVIPTTGATYVSLDEHYISIEQESTMGDQAASVHIPRALFLTVMHPIFSTLEAWELSDIARAIENHLKESAKEGI